MRRILGDDGAADDNQRDPPRRLSGGENDGREARRSRCVSSAAKFYPERRLTNRRAVLALYSGLPCLFTSSITRSCTTRSSRSAIRRRSPEHFRRAATRISVLLAAEAMRELPHAAGDVSSRRSDPPPGRGRPRRRRRASTARRARHARRHSRAGADRAGRPHRAAARRNHGGRLAVLLEIAVAPRASFVLIINPMLATGGSAIAALDLLHNAGARRVHVLCIVAAPEGIAALEGGFPIPTFHADSRSGSERAQVHRAWSWRFRRSSVRNRLTSSEPRRSWHSASGHSTPQRVPRLRRNDGRPR